MIEPQRIGRFLYVDEFGYVQPDVAIDRVDKIWTPFIEALLRALTKRQGGRSVYLRGSIPRGLAIENVSDADVIYFSEFNFDSADSALEKAVEAEFPFLKGLELFRLDRSTFNRVNHPKQRPYFHMLLRTQSLLLAGDDLTRDIEPFKIGPDMVSHVFSLEKEFSGLPGRLDAAPRAGVERTMRQWFSRRIVRSGFEVTMDRSHCFTRDLYLCYEQFARFYPQRSKQMYQVLVNCLNGEENPVQYSELVTFLANESSRLLTN
jgi:uncharacterized protein